MFLRWPTPSRSNEESGRQGPLIMTQTPNAEYRISGRAEAGHALKVLLAAASPLFAAQLGWLVVK